MFGEEGLVTNLTAGATAIAEGPVECVGLDRTTFTEVRANVLGKYLIFFSLGARDVVAYGSCTTRRFGFVSRRRGVLVRGVFGVALCTARLPSRRRPF